MKKFLLIAVAVLGFSFAAIAQPRAIGIRAGYGAEVSYQHTLGAANFAEIDLGWSVGSFNAELWAGIGAQLGLEYCFEEIPLQLSLDWKPSFNLVPATGFGWQGLALGIRYLF